MNEADIAALHFAAGDLVDLQSHGRGGTRYARGFKIVPYPIPRGCAASYFPEANALVQLDEVAERSHTPASKSIVISISRST
jgi:anaerobic selenocysteine-containing dehydrogenase